MKNNDNTNMIFMTKANRWYVLNKNTNLVALCDSRTHARNERSRLLSNGIQAEIGTMIFQHDPKAQSLDTWGAYAPLFGGTHVTSLLCE